jgi:hypothetical protein
MVEQPSHGLRDLLVGTATRVADYREAVAGRPVFPRVDFEAVRARLGSLPDRPSPAAAVLEELANIVERLIILSPRPAITAEDVASALPAGDGGSAPLPGSTGLQLALTEELDRFEKTLITRALSAAGGNVAEAARRLSTDRANLYRRMKRLGIEGLA